MCVLCWAVCSLFVVCCVLFECVVVRLWFVLLVLSVVCSLWVACCGSLTVVRRVLFALHCLLCVVRCRVSLVVCCGLFICFVGYCFMIVEC